MDNSNLGNTGFQSNAGQQISPDGISATPRPSAYQAQFAESAQPAVQYSGGVSYSPTPGGAPLSPTPAPTPTPEPEEVEQPKRRARFRGIRLSGTTRIVMIVGVIFLLGGAAAIGGYMFWKANQPAATTHSDLNSPAGSFDVQQLSLSQLSASTLPTIQGSRKLSINGQLEVNNSMVIAPTAQPTNPVAGQIYYDNGTNILKYFNGTNFVDLQAQQSQAQTQTQNQQTTTPSVQSVNGVSGQITLGDGLSLANNILSNSGVLSVQGQAGAVTLTGGNGITIDGTTIGNSGALSIASGSSNVSVTNDGSGNYTIGVATGGGTVTSSGGSVGTFAMFTGSQNIESSIVSQSGLTVTITGDLSVVTGGLSLSNALTVSNGGTGVQSLAGNGVLVGNGTAPISSVVAGSPGLCLLSTSGLPAWGACPSGGGVTSLNGLSGGLSLSNASGSGSTITIDNASTTAKGIASFNSTNFTATGGAINTVQNINTGATPTFAGINTNSITPSSALTVGATNQSFTMQGNASSVITATGGSGTTTLAFASPTANVTYRLQSAPAGTYDICTNAGNCAGVGGGVTTAGGTTNRIAKFNGTQTIADSIITDDGTTVTVGGSLSVTGNGTFSGDVAVNGGDITSTGALNITPTGTLTVGSVGQQLTLQGNGSTSLSANSGSFKSSLTFQVPTANVTYRLPGTTAGSYDICTTAGNCVGTGGGVSTSGGTVNKLAKFGGTQTIDNSSITDDGVNVTTTANLVVQGGTTTIGVAGSQVGSLKLADSGSSFLGTVIQGSLSANRTYTLPDASGTICLSSGNCSGAGSSATLQAAYDAGNTLTTTSARDINFTLADTATDSNFNVNVATGATGYVAINRANGAGTSDPAQLLLLSNLDIDRPLPVALKIQSAGGGITTGIDLTDASIGTAVAVGTNDITGTTGNITFTNFGVNGSNGNVTSGLVNGQTISSTANFTGTMAVAGNLTLASDVAVNGGDITSTGTLNITPTGTLTAGSTAQQLVLQGNASTTLSATGGGFTTTIGFAGTPTGAVTYNFDRSATAGTYTVCSTAGNCAGVGGGVTTAGGTVGTLPVFSGSQAIGNSLVSQSGSVVSVNGNLNLTSGHQFTINGTQISSSALSNDSDLAKLSSSETFTGNSVAFKNATNSTGSFSVQNTGGTKVLTVDTTNGQIVLGAGSVLDGKLVFSNVSNANTVTINPGTPTANRTLTLPNAGGIICTDSGNCAGAGATLQTGYNFSAGGTTPKIKLNSTLLGVDIQDADTTIGADLFDVRASNAVGLGSVMFGVGNTGQVTLQNSSNSTTAFRVLTAAGTAVLTGDTTNGQIMLGQSGTLGGSLVFRNASNSNTVSLVSAAATSNQTITLPNSTGTICLSSGNCSGAGSSATLQAAYDAGNAVTTTNNRDLSFTLADTTTDSNFLVNLQCTTACGSNGRFAIQSGGTDVFAVAPTGGAVLLRNATDSSTAFQVQRSDSTTLLAVDTSASKVTVTGDIIQTGIKPATVAGTGTNGNLSSLAAAAGGNTTGTTGQSGGNGGSLFLAGGDGGNAPSGSANGWGGNVIISGGAAGSGAGSAGLRGNVILQGNGGTVGIGTLSPSTSYKLDVAGDINISSGSAYRINGTSICTSSGCTAASGSGFYIQNGTSQQASSNFNISGTGTATTFSASLYDSPTGTLNLATGSATASSILFGHSASFANGADRTLTVQTAVSGNNGNNFTIAAGNGNGTSKSGGNLVLQGGSATSGGTGGSVIVKPLTDSVGALLVQNNAGTTTVLSADTTNNRVGIGKASPAYTLDVAGDANLSSGSVYRINGTAICSASGCTATSASAILNQSGSTQAANFKIQSATDINTAVIMSNGSQTADLLQFQSSTGGPVAGVRPSGAIWSAPVVDPNTDVPGNARLFIQPLSNSSTAIIARAAAGGAPTGNILMLQDATGANNLFAVGPTGITTFQNTSDTDTAFVVNNTGGNSVLRVDTANQKVAIGLSSGTIPAKLYVSTGSTVAFRAKQTGSSNVLELANGTSNVVTVTSTGTALFQTTTNSVNAFQVQNLSGTDVFNVDTSNGRVGVGSSSNAPNRTLDVSTSDTSTNSLPILVGQNGTGDSGIEIKNSSESFYMGIDSSDTNAFKINSATTAAGKLLGNDGIGPSSDTGDRNAMNGTQFTASATGTISTLYAYVKSPLGTSPNNQGQMAIYSDSSGAPGTKLASSASVTLAGDSWNAFTISSTSVTAGTKYWLMYNSNATADTQNNLKANWNVGNGYFKLQTFGTWPTTYGTGTSFTGTYSMYATITASAPSDQFLNTIFKLARTGALTLQNVDDTTSAFQILSSTSTGSTPIFTVDTADGYAYLKGQGSNYGGSTLFFGDSDNVAVGENGTGDSDVLHLYGLAGLNLDTGNGTGVYVDSQSNIGLRTSSTVSGYTVANGGLVVRNADTPTKQYRFRTSGGSLDMEAGGANLYISNWSNADFTGTQYTGIILYYNQSRMDLNSTYTYFNPTTSPSGDLVDFNRSTAGTILGFAQAGTIQGSISINGATVSYNAFTGSHFAWSDGSIDRGKVVSMTGNNKHKNPNDSGDEPIYGVKVTSQANDPAVLGAYLGLMNPEEDESLNNPEQIMSVGNGDMWVDDEGGNIQPGDFLISSTNPGYAMKDDGQFAESNVIARASDAVNWSNETKVVNGHKVRKISVLFSAFTRLNATGLSQGAWNGGLVGMDTTFNALVTFNKNVTFNGDANFNGTTNFKGNVNFRSNTAGTVTIPAGDKTVTVTFSHPHDQIPVVNVTPGQFVGGSYRVRDVAKDKFVIELSQAQSTDIQFNWSALSTTPDTN